MENKSISKSVIWQLSGKFLLQGVAFFTTPIFTRILTPADYGYTALYTSWASVIGLIVGLQVQGSIGNARLHYHKEEINKYLSSIMSISLISFFLVLLSAIFLGNWLSLLLGLTPDLLFLVIFQSFAAFIINFEVARLDQYKKVEKSTILSLVHIILVISISLAFVFLTKGNKAVARIYGQAIPTILIGIVILILIYSRGNTFWRQDYNKYCLVLTVPLIIHGLGHIIFAQSDRIMLQKMKGNEFLGVYSISYTLCSVLMIIYGSLNTAWIPFYYDFKKQNKQEEILNHSKRYLKLFSIITIGFALLSYDVYKIMAPSEYFEGIGILPLFVCSIYFGFLYLFPVNFEFYHCQTKIIPLGTIFAAGINILLNFILIPRFGIVGAALGTLFSHFILFCFHWIIATYILKFDFEYKLSTFIFCIIITISLVLISYLIKDFFIIRWIISAILGLYLIQNISKKRSFF